MKPTQQELLGYLLFISSASAVEAKTGRLSEPKEVTEKLGISAKQMQKLLADKPHLRQHGKKVYEFIAKLTK